jgi:hypothetical protein
MRTKNPNTFSLYDLNLGEELQFTDDTYALRVPGGWIFTAFRENGTGANDSSSCFVPFDNEFLNR